MRGFKPYELSSLLWGFVKLGQHVSSDPLATRLFQAAATYIIGNVKLFKYRSLATIAWAFATAKHWSPRLLAVLAVEMSRTVDSANSQEIANTAWAFGTLGYRHEQLSESLATAALAVLEDFKPQELSNMLWGFGSNGFFHEILFKRALVLAQRMDLLPQHLANIAWAIGRLRPQHPLVRSTTLALLPTCTRQVAAFKPQEVSSTLQAAGRIFGRAREPLAPCRDFPSGAPLHPNVLAFIAATRPYIQASIQSFSEQSLANAAAAFAMFGLDEPGGITSVLEQEALTRAAGLDPSGLVVLLKGFAGSRAGWCITRFSAAQLVHRFFEIKESDLRVLARAWGSYNGLTQHGQQPSQAELYDWLMELARGPETQPPRLPSWDGEPPGGSGLTRPCWSAGLEASDPRRPPAWHADHRVVEPVLFTEQDAGLSVPKSGRWEPQRSTDPAFLSPPFMEARPFGRLPQDVEALAFEPLSGDAEVRAFDRLPRDVEAPAFDRLSQDSETHVFNIEARTGDCLSRAETCAFNSLSRDPPSTGEEKPFCLGASRQEAQTPEPQVAAEGRRKEEPAGGEMPWPRVQIRPRAELRLALDGEVHGTEADGYPYIVKNTFIEASEPSTEQQERRLGTLNFRSEPVKAPSFGSLGALKVHMPQGLRQTLQKSFLHLESSEEHDAAGAGDKV